MIEEAYVSFETAKLLKEKGFDEYSPLWYDINNPSKGPTFYKAIGWYGHNSCDYNGRNIVSAPTQQIVMRWLREIKYIAINIWFDGEMWSSERGLISADDKEFVFIGHYNTYEEACEKAIKYYLEHLI